MGSKEDKSVLEFVQHRAGKYAQSIEYRDFDGAIVVKIPMSSVAKKAGNRKTSKRQVTQLKNDVKKIYNRELLAIVILDDNHEAVELALGTLLSQRFPKVIRGVFVSVPSIDNVTVILEPFDNKPPAEEVLEDIKELVEKFLDLQELHLGAIEWAGATGERPSLPVLLRLVKTLAPVEVEDIGLSLRKQDRWYVDAKDIRHSLDALRKKGLVIRQKTGKYVPTEAALHVIPHGPTRNSSDVDRALELGRRKW